MTSEQFGQWALQLVRQAQIPFDGIPAALEFARMAEALAKGDLTVKEKTDDPRT